MAITLDELLGRNVTAEKNTDIFPSYEEFSSVRNLGARTAERDGGYGSSVNYDRYSAPTQYSAPVQPRYREDVYGGDDLVRPARQQSFYDYVALNNTQIDDVELYNRLSRTNDGMRPAFERDEVAKRSGVRSAQAIGAQQKTRGRLNTKGKLILGSFLAVVVTVMSLIIAYASKINSGTAVVPASNAAASISTVL